MRTDMVFEDQSAHALRLTVAQGKLDTNQFTVVARELKIFSPKITIEAAIIGASHYVSFGILGRTIHEVFACTDVKAPGNLASVRPWPDASGTVTFSFDSDPVCTYTMTPTLKNWSEGVGELMQMEKTINRVSKWRNRIGLVFAFPKGNLQEEPKTLLLLQYYNEQRIRVETAHAYPNEGTIAFTCSELQIGEIRR